MDEIIGLQHFADGSDPSIHHVRRRYDIGPGLGVRQRLFNQHRYGFIVQHITRAVDQPVLTVTRKRVQRDIGDHTQFRQCLFEGAHCPLRQTIGIIRFSSVQ